MAPGCCSCNGSGRCKSCCCVRRGSPCADCYLGEERCQNGRLPGATSSSSQLLPGPALPRRNVLISSSQPVTGSKADFPPRPAKAFVDSSSSRPPFSQQTRNPLPRTTPASHLSRNDSYTMEGGAMQSVSTTAANAAVSAASDPDGSPGTNRGDRGAGESNRPVDSRSLDENQPHVVGSQPEQSDPVRKELPASQPASAQQFTWGSLEGEDFAHALSAAYAEVVHWRRNIFCIPSGSAGKVFVLEVSRLIRAFCEGSALETVAMKAIMVLPHVVLQKPHPSSTAKEHHACLERRLEARRHRWTNPWRSHNSTSSTDQLF